MTATILDIETTFQRLDKGKHDPSPFHPDNFMVCIGWNEGKSIKTTFDMSSRKLVQSVLDKTGRLVGHNIKFDLQWLLESGYTYDGEVWDTMLFEYLMNKGRKGIKVDLSSCCKRRGIPSKIDKVKEYWDKGYNTDDIPVKILNEYLRQDVRITKKLYLEQQKIYGEWV